jgi:propanol-preferring alcohol dehydrogenase
MSTVATMRAAVLRGEAGTGLFAVEDVAVPQPGPGEVRVRILRTGICGSDVHFVLDGSARTAYTPIVLGHESVGVVDAHGSGVDAAALPLQTRVAIVPLITCNHCARCAAGRTVVCAERACLGSDVEGTYAHYAVVPARNLLLVPSGLADELAAVATDSVATALHAVATRGGVTRGTRVAVFGTGGLGLSAVGVARALGAGVIVAVDPREEARAWATQTGADQALHPDDAASTVAALGGVDVALEFVGRQSSSEAAVRSLDHGGRAVIVGVGHEPVGAGRLMTFVLREREVVGSYGAEPSEVARALDMLATGALQLPRVIGDVVPLDGIVDAMHRVQQGRTGGSRIVVDLTA